MNTLLAALPDKDYQRLATKLKTVSLERGQILYQADSPIEEIYFPDSGVVSLLATSPTGEMIEIGIVGYEGAVGLPVLLGMNETFVTTRVQIEGTARRIRAAMLRREFDQCGTLHQILLRYLYSLIHQLSQSVFCNQFHTDAQRLMRWLLTMRDRTQTNILPLTHEFIAQMLGSARPGVSTILGGLQNTGLISQSRGRITITDSDRMEAAACDCYQALKAEFEELLAF